MECPLPCTRISSVIERMHMQTLRPILWAEMCTERSTNKWYTFGDTGEGELHTGPSIYWAADLRWYAVTWCISVPKPDQRQAGTLKFYSWEQWYKIERERQDPGITLCDACHMNQTPGDFRHIHSCQSAGFWRRCCTVGLAWDVQVSAVLLDWRTCERHCLCKYRFSGCGFCWKTLRKSNRACSLPEYRGEIHPSQWKELFQAHIFVSQTLDQRTLRLSGGHRVNMLTVN